jgi:23S rRNA (pseudouridine1915-N3)-methyltransferase
MKVAFWWIGRTNEKYLEQGINIYLKRLKHYTNCETTIIKDVKPQKDISKWKELESDAILSRLQPTDYLILCDEKGKKYDSLNLSLQIEKWRMNSSYKRLIFLVAGAYGASETLKERSNHQLSLSDLTFSHQMVRLFLVEQVYRSFTIINNEKYHNV